MTPCTFVILYLQEKVQVWLAGPKTALYLSMDTNADMADMLSSRSIDSPQAAYEGELRSSWV